MNDTEIERTLRATFAGKASTVTAGPQWTDEVEVLDSRRTRHRRPRWIAPLAAAAAVLVAIGGGLVAAQQLRSHHHPVTQHQKTKVIDRAACTSTLSPAWRSAISAGTASYGTQQLRLAGVTSEGTEIVDYSPPGSSTASTTIAIGTLPPGSTTPRLLTQFTHAGDGAAYDVQVDGNTVLVAINFAGSGNAGIDGAPSQIAVVDARTGARTMLLNLYSLPRTHRPTTDAAFLFGGAAYWDEYPHGQPSREVVHRYDLSTRIDQVVYDGSGGDGLHRSAAGVWWTGSAVVPNVPAPLPAAVAEHASFQAALESLTTDGTGYAWSDRSTLNWWAPGHDVVTVHVAHTGLNGVAGPVIVFDKDKTSALFLLDTRTGAVTSLKNTGLQLANRGVLYLGNEPHVITNSTVYTITRLAATSLPPLSC